MSRNVVPYLHTLFPISLGYSKLQSLNTLVKAVKQGVKLTIISIVKRYFNSQSTQNAPKYLKRHSSDGSLPILSSGA